MSVKSHYDDHLSNFYEWMVGDFDSAQKTQQTFFENNGILPKQNKIAVDLGCGHGIHAVSLAKLGFSVKAIDFNNQLLNSLKNRAENLDIEAILSDLNSFHEHVKKAGLIVCMGDTISHLESIKQLKDLLKKIFQTLETNGKLVISYRDYTRELNDTERFIQVRSDDNRILTCVLEYFKTTIRVTDLLHEKVDGKWIQKVSSYYKLRLKKDEVEKMVEACGFKNITTSILNGMHYLIAEK